MTLPSPDCHSNSSTYIAVSEVDGSLQHGLTCQLGDDLDETSDLVSGRGLLTGHLEPLLSNDCQAGGLQRKGIIIKMLEVSQNHDDNVINWK